MLEIRLVNLRKEFKDVVAVRDVNVTFRPSAVTCILGPSGCGKTTLMRLIAGLETPTAGEVYFDSQPVTQLAPSQRRVGMVFQSPVVYKGMTALQNIELPLSHEKLSAAERRKRIEQVVEIVQLQDVINTNVDQLDTSTCQKVAVAREVARQPEVIMLDEPLTNVDVNVKVQLKLALKELTRGLNKTIIYVTHDQNEAMTLADRIALMREGAIIQYDDPQLVFNQPSQVFGGWFMGSPGMNFYEMTTNNLEEAGRLMGVLGTVLLRLPQIGKEQRITVGIRPEHVRALKDATPSAVKGHIIRKAIVVGGQYLLVIDVNGKPVKAKVDPALGYGLQGEVWVEFPPERVLVFDEKENRLDIPLSAIKQGL